MSRLYQLSRLSQEGIDVEADMEQTQAEMFDTIDRYHKPSENTPNRWRRAYMPGHRSEWNEIESLDGLASLRMMYI